MRTANPSHEEVMVELDMCVSNIIEESIRFFSPRWKYVTTMDINNRSSSKYARTLICVYNQTCDCNARIKVEFSALKNKINVYWYTFSSAHGMPSDLNNRFLNFNLHSMFPHYRVHQNSEFDISTKSVQLTIELQQSIEKVLASSPNISPSHLLRELKKQVCFLLVNLLDKS